MPESKTTAFMPPEHDENSAQHLKYGQRAQKQWTRQSSKRFEKPDAVFKDKSNLLIKLKKSEVMNPEADYDDEHANDIYSEAQDVAAFLMWAAEPKMMARKHSGFVGVLFLVLLSVLLYLTNKRLWAPIKKESISS